MLDVNSGTSVVVGPERRAGRSTHNAPTTAPARLPSPPITAIATSASESSTRKKRSEDPNVRFDRRRAARRRARRRSRRRANAMSLARAGDTVSAAAAGSFSRTPTIMRPMPVRRRCPTSSSTSDEHDEHEVVVRAVAVGEVERPEVGARDLDRRAAGGEDRPVEEVDLRGDRERERADREQQPVHAQRADADEHRDQARERRAEQQRPRERDARQARRRGSGCRASRCSN